MSFAGCLLAILLLSSCATSYRPLKHHSGYYEQALGKQQYEVSFLGNANTPYDRVLDFALLRAAEIALRQQAKSFSVLDVVHLSSARKYRTSTQFFRTASPYFSRGEVVPSANESTAGFHQSYTMMAPSQERVFYRPGVRLSIKLSPYPAANGPAYDPTKVKEHLQRKYGLK